jgi:hypothetical protein
MARPSSALRSLNVLWFDQAREIIRLAALIDIANNGQSHGQTDKPCPYFPPSGCRASSRTCLATIFRSHVPTGGLCTHQHQHAWDEFVASDSGIMGGQCDRHYLAHLVRRRDAAW